MAASSVAYKVLNTYICKAIYQTQSLEWKLTFAWNFATATTEKNIITILVIKTTEKYLYIDISTKQRKNQWNDNTIFLNTT